VLVAVYSLALRGIAKRADEVIVTFVICKEYVQGLVGEFEPGEAKRYVVEVGFEKDETQSYRYTLSNKMGPIRMGRHGAVQEIVRERIMDCLKRQRGEGDS
jgi:hypothetical protein